MGCASSSARARRAGSEESIPRAEAAQRAPSDPSAAGGRPKPGGKRLLDEYVVGEKLGEGAFGVVSSCSHRSTGTAYAVKMVDRVETPVDEIKREAALLGSLDHANVVKIHGVFYERCFVCIVMDKYGGGDLVEGLQRHLQQKGPVNCHHIVHVSRQMGASLQYIHMKMIAHRDIKGDNYLVDRRDMTSPDCKVALSDFGAACHVGRNERLGAAAGTQIFWAPEFFDRDYGLKVDVWAMGIIMFGLVTGRFPFADEADIRTKDPRMPKRANHVCQDFIRKLLEKKEAARLSADQVMAHDWVDYGLKVAAASAQREQGMTAGRSDSIDDDSPMQDMRIGDANDGIKERRQELMERLQKEHSFENSKDEQGRAVTPMEAKLSRHADANKFVLKDRMNNRMVYEWFDKARQRNLDDWFIKGKESSEELLKESTDHKMFSKILEDHNIDVSAFGKGKAKTLPQLAAEVHGGAARLMLDATEHKKLVRVCDVVVLKLKSDVGERILIETEEEFCDGRKRVTNWLPGTTKEPYENTRQVAERILREFLRFDPKGVELDLRRVERVEEQWDSISYPGVMTVYRKELVEGVLSIADWQELAKVGLSMKDGLPSYSAWRATDAEGNTKFFSWMTNKECDDNEVKLYLQTQEISSLVRAPIGLDEEALRKHLTNCGIDVSKFGGPNTKTMKEFSAELVRGESTLSEDSSGNALRVVDVVVVIISRSAGSELLVQSEHISSKGTKATLNRLPGAKRRPDENPFLCARRIIRRQLEIDDNRVDLDRVVQNIEEEEDSPAYPGLKTVCLKRHIRGVMV